MSFGVLGDVPLESLDALIGVKVSGFKNGPSAGMVSTAYERREKATYLQQTRRL